MMRPANVDTALASLLDATGLAERHGITERHGRRLVAERRIPFVKVGRFVRFNPSAVTAWLERATVGAPVEKGR